jgi:pre-mRNA-splicing factor CDC5/CEF1
MQLVGGTPRDLKLSQLAMKHSLKRGLASLPKPKETEWDLELPEEQQETNGVEELSEEDAAIRDRREEQIRLSLEKLEFSRRSQVMQRNLPRPAALDIDAIVGSSADDIVKREAALLIAHDALRYPISGAKVRGTPQPLEKFDDDALANARLMIALEVPSDLAEKGSGTFKAAWADAHSSSLLPGLSAYGEDDEIDEHQMLVEAFNVRTPLCLPNTII